MYFLKGTNPLVKVKYYSLPPNLKTFLETVDLQFGANYMPTKNSLFVLDENEQIVQIRSQQDYERHWNLLKPASGHTPFVMYAYLKNITKVEEILRRGPPESVKNYQHQVHSYIDSMILTGAAASDERERGAATESAAREDIDLEYLIFTAPAQFDRTFR